MVGKRGSLKERFEEKFEIGPEDACWLWQASDNGEGYGMIWDQDKRRKVLATRVSYELNKGPLLDTDLVLHSCDNPLCVNPSHLRIGTHKDNVADMDERNRRVTNTPFGEANCNAIFTEQQIIQMRRDYISGVPKADIAAANGTTSASLNDIITGSSWKHLLGVNGAPSLADLKAARRITTVTESDVREIWRLHASGKSAPQIAKLTRQSIHSVDGIVQGKTWRHLHDAPSALELKAGGVQRGYNQFSGGGDTRTVHPRTKIPSSAIPSILSRIDAGETLEAIGNTYGVKKTAIWRIRNAARPTPSSG